MTDEIGDTDDVSRVATPMVVADLPAPPTDAIERARRAFRRPLLLIGVIATLLAVLVVSGVIYGTVTIVAQRQIHDSQGRLECVARLQAQLGRAQGLALAAPPAPNPQREAAVRGIAVAADRLGHFDRYC